MEIQGRNFFFFFFAEMEMQERYTITSENNASPHYTIICKVRYRTYVRTDVAVTPLLGGIRSVFSLNKGLLESQEVWPSGHEKSMSVSLP